MYRFFLLLSVMLATAAGLYFGLPWYLLAVAAAVLTLLFPVWRRAAFGFSFVAAFLVWGVYAGYLHFESEGRLSDRLAVAFGLAEGWSLVAVTALWAGITAGLGGWFGASLRRTFVQWPRLVAKR